MTGFFVLGYLGSYRMMMLLFKKKNLDFLLLIFKIMFLRQKSYYVYQANFELSNLVASATRVAGAVDVHYEC